MESNKISKDFEKRAGNFFQKEWHEFTELEKKVLHSVVEKRRISRNTNKVTDDECPFGERIADKVASFGGSWAFIISSSIYLALVSGLN